MEQKKIDGRTIVIGVHSVHDADGFLFDNAIPIFPRDEKTEEEIEDCEQILELYGDWVEGGEDSEYEYVPAPDAKFLAQFNIDGATIEVYKSDWAVKCMMCSPCYPNCGDVDTEGDDYIAYILPLDMLNEEWLKENRDRIIELGGEDEFSFINK